MARRARNRLLARHKNQSASPDLQKQTENTTNYETGSNLTFHVLSLKCEHHIGQHRQTPNKVIEVVARECNLLKNQGTQLLLSKKSLELDLLDIAPKSKHFGWWISATSMVEWFHVISFDLVQTVWILDHFGSLFNLSVQVECSKITYRAQRVTPDVCFAWLLPSQPKSVEEYICTKSLGNDHINKTDWDGHFPCFIPNMLINSFPSADLHVSQPEKLPDHGATCWRGAVRGELFSDSLVFNHSQSRMKNWHVWDHGTRETEGCSCCHGASRLALNWTRQLAFEASWLLCCSTCFRRKERKKPTAMLWVYYLARLKVSGSTGKCLFVWGGWWGMFEPNCRAQRHLPSVYGRVWHIYTYNYTVCIYIYILYKYDIYIYTHLHTFTIHFTFTVLTCYNLDHPLNLDGAALSFHKSNMEPLKIRSLGCRLWHDMLPPKSDSK